MNNFNEKKKTIMKADQITGNLVDKNQRECNF